MRILATLLVLVAVLCAAPGARAVPVAPGTVVTAPDWSAGSEWYYSDGYALKVNSASAQGAVFDRLDAPGQWFSRQGFIRKDSASATATRNAIYRTIPDAAGFTLTAGSPLTFQREYLANGKLLVHASSWAVEGRETITVPAGTFDCWVIVWRTRSLRSDWTGFERWWYSPQVQNYVRMEFKYGPSPDGSRVLMRYRLGPEPVSAPAATAAAAPVPAVAVAPAPLPKPVEVAAAPPPAPVTATAPPAPLPRIPEPPAPVVAEAPPIAILPKSVEAPPPVAAVPAREAPVREAAPAAVPPLDEKPAPAKPAKAAVKTAQAAAPASGGKVGAWHAQVGSSKDAAAMRASLNKTLADNPAVESLPSGIAAHNIAGRGTFFRAWLGSYDTAKEALALCQTLKTHGPGCAVFKGASVEARAD